MKNVKKILALLLSGIMVLALSSCRQLDETKKTAAFWVDDTSETIEWQGRKYLLSQMRPGDLEIMTYGPTIYVNEPDVPVLMSSYEGLRFHTDRFDRILYYDYGMTDRNVPVDAIYIREDLIDTLDKDFRERNTDHYCLEGRTLYGEDWFLLSDELAERLDKAIKEGTPIDPSEMDNEDFEADIYPLLFEYDDQLYVNACDASMLIRGRTLMISYKENDKGQRQVLVEIKAEPDQYILLQDPSIYDELKKRQAEASDITFPEGV